jgi:hypothetical protein
LHKKWDIQEEANQATPFDEQGIPIEECLRKWILKKSQTQQQHTNSNTYCSPPKIIPTKLATDIKPLMASQNPFFNNFTNKHHNPVCKCE